MLPTLMTKNNRFAGLNLFDDDLGFPTPLVNSGNWTEDENAYYMSIDMPGFSREDIMVTIEADNLSIVAENEKRRSLRYEASLLKTIDAEKITASLDNGVLTVTMPKSERMKPRKIEILAGG